MYDKKNKITTLFLESYKTSDHTRLDSSNTKYMVFVTETNVKISFHSVPELFLLIQSEQKSLLIISHPVLLYIPCHIDLKSTSKTLQRETVPPITVDLLQPTYWYVNPSLH